jgi:hypothetical protein
MCQWIHLYQISRHDVFVFLKTMHSVFPHLSVWVDGSDMLILASQNSLKPEPLQIFNRMTRPAIKRSLDPAEITPENIMKIYVSDETMLKVLRRTLEVNTDDFPILEFSAPRSLFLNQSKEIAQSLHQLKYLAGQTD